MTDTLEYCICQLYMGLCALVESCQTWAAYVGIGWTTAVRVSLLRRMRAASGIARHVGREPLHRLSP